MLGNEGSAPAFWLTLRGGTALRSERLGPELAGIRRCPAPAFSCRALHGWAFYGFCGPKTSKRRLADELTSFLQIPQLTRHLRLRFRIGVGAQALQSRFRTACNRHTCTLSFLPSLLPCLLPSFRCLSPCRVSASGVLESRLDELLEGDLTHDLPTESGVLTATGESFELSFGRRAGALALLALPAGAASEALGSASASGESGDLF